MTIAVTAERASGFVAPEAAGRRAPLFHELDRSAGVVDDGLDLAPVAHDPWVLEEPFHQRGSPSWAMKTVMDSARQERGPRISELRGDLDDFGRDTLLQAVEGRVVGRHGTALARLDASDQQEDSVIHALLDPCPMVCHVIRSLALVGCKAAQ